MSNREWVTASYASVLTPIFQVAANDAVELPVIHAGKAYLLGFEESHGYYIRYDNTRDEWRS